MTSFIKILICNTHSTLNPGDTAIVLAQIDLLRECLPNAQIAITSRTHTIDKDFYNNIGIQVFPTLIPSTNCHKGLNNKIKAFFGDIKNIKSKIALLRTIRYCDILVSSGGGYLFSYNKFLPELTFIQNIAHIVLGIIFKKRIILFPQSFGPFNNYYSRMFTKYVLQSKYISHIFARESISYEILKKILNKKSAKKLILSSDMALLLENKHFRNKGNKEQKITHPIVGITLRNWTFPEVLIKNIRKQKFDNYITALKNISLEIIYKHKGKVVVIPQVRGPEDSENDLLMSQNFMKLFEKEQASGSISLWNPPQMVTPFQIIDAISKLDLLIATRFHSAIFGLLARVPIISIGYQHKSMGILQYLQMDKYCMFIENINAGMILGHVENILSNKDLISEEISNHIFKAQPKIKNTVISAIA